MRRRMPLSWVASLRMISTSWCRINALPIARSLLWVTMQSCPTYSPNGELTLMHTASADRTGSMLTTSRITSYPPFHESVHRARLRESRNSALVRRAPDS